MCGSFQKTVSNPCDSHIARHERDDSLALQTKSICQRTGRKQQIRTVRSELPSNPLGLPMMLSGTNSTERRKTEQQSKQITEHTAKIQERRNSRTVPRKSASHNANNQHERSDMNGMLHVGGNNDSSRRNTKIVRKKCASNRTSNGDPIIHRPSSLNGLLQIGGNGFVKK